MIYKPHNYQEHATEYIMDNKECGLFLDMGLGKTVSTLTAIDRLMFEEFEVDKVLVIAPKKVAEDTWIAERDKWDHLKHLKLSIVLGNEKQRLQALRCKTDIYIINRENVAWLVSHYNEAWPFDMVVIDELSSFKSAKSIRFKHLRTVRPKMKRIVGLTGTPAPNGLLDLWPQLYLLDQGQRLGKTITGYRQQYFREGNRNGHIIYDYNLKDGMDKEIFEKIGDICISMKAADYLELPERIDRIKEVVLPAAIMQKYQDFEKSLILALDGEEEISAMNAAGLTNKLLQFANGAVYDDERNWHVMHDEKIQALEEDIEAANGQPVLVFYQFRHDLERLMYHFRKMKPVLINGSDDIKRWNNKEIQLMFAHAKSAGHGLNLQNGGNLLFWFGPTWALEEYQQAIARLHRQGQLKPVINTRIIAKGTMDEDVLKALENKTGVQDAVMEAVKARIKKYRN